MPTRACAWLISVPLSWTRSGFPGIVVAEPPEMPFGVAAAIAFAAVILGFELVDDHGSRRFRASVVRVGIGDDHAATLRFPSADLVGLCDAAAPRACVIDGAQHDHTVAERELRVMDDGAVGVDRVTLEAEGAAQPVDGGRRVA